MKLSGKTPIFSPMIITSLKGYNSKKLFSDLIAGLIVAIIAMPLSIALALASGVGPIEGLYTAIIAGLVVALLGGSSVQISGPTAAFATIVAGIVASSGMKGLALSGAIAGVFIILFGIFLLGTYICLIPKPIVVGFTGGIAVTILVGQFKDFFGITYSERPIETLEKFSLFFSNFNTFKWASLLLGVLSLLIIVVWPYVKKIGKVIPSSLIALLFASILVIILKKNIPDIEIKTIGDLYKIRQGAPHFTPLDFGAVDGWFLVIKNAVIIAVLASIESLLSAVVADKMLTEEIEKDKKGAKDIEAVKHNSNTELIATGLANILSVLFGGIPATGAIARTAANIKNGGRTPIAGIFHAILLFLVLLFLVPYASLIPMPTIAAILFSVAYNMSGWRNFRQIIKDKKIVPIIELFLTFILTVCFDLIVAIVVSIALHLVLKLVKLDKK